LTELLFVSFSSNRLLYDIYATKKRSRDLPADVKASQKEKSKEIETEFYWL